MRDPNEKVQKWQSSNSLPMNKHQIKNFISRIVEDVRNNDLSDKNLIDKYVREFIFQDKEIDLCQNNNYLGNDFVNEGIKKALRVVSEVWEEIPLVYDYDEDARYNYPERENEVYKRLNSLLST